MPGQRLIKMVVIDGVRYKPEDAERLGLVKLAHKAMTPEQTATHIPVEDTTAPVGVNGNEDDDEGDIDAPEQPSKSGSRVAWVEFAKALGASDDDLDGMSRDEIAEVYGG